MSTNQTVAFVSVNEALNHIKGLPISPTVFSNTVQLSRRGLSTLRWIGLGLTNLGLDTFAGLFAYQTKCAALAMIPTVGTISGATCIIALIATMVLIAGISALIAGGAEGSIGKDGVEISTRSLFKRDGSEFFTDDFIQYGHHANLTFYHSYWRSCGLNTSVVLDDSSTYYYIGDSLFGTNVTNVYQAPTGHNVFAQHGQNASRLFLPYYGNSLAKRGWEEEYSIDQYGNGFNDEYLSGGYGFKGQYCHPYGSSETISPQNDWTTINTLINDVTGGGATDHYNLWAFDVVDLNHNEEEICAIEIEGESEGFGSNEEWSEEGLCEAPIP